MRDDVHITSLHLENMTQSPITLVAEPWADEFEMRPGQKFRILGTSPHRDGLGVEYYPEMIIVTGFRDSSMSIYLNDEKHWESWAPVPLSR